MKKILMILTFGVSLSAAAEHCGNGFQAKLIINAFANTYSNPARVELESVTLAENDKFGVHHKYVYNFDFAEGTPDGRGWMFHRKVTVLFQEHTCNLLSLDVDRL